MSWSIIMHMVYFVRDIVESLGEIREVTWVLLMVSAALHDDLS